MRKFNWQDSEPKEMNSSIDIHNVSIAKIPILKLPFDDFLNNEERELLVKLIKKSEPKQYDGTEVYQDVKYLGIPFVDCISCEDYLLKQEDKKIEKIIPPLLNKMTHFLESYGYKVSILYDDFYKKYYKVGSIRLINVSANDSVLHVDSLLIDGTKKSDFHIPTNILNKDVTQVSFNILLEDGGKEVDNLYVYNKVIDSDSEKFRMSNGWQFPLSIVKDSQECIYTPHLNDCFMFCTNLLHDIRGEKDNAERITFSIFGLYDKYKKEFFLYN